MWKHEQLGLILSVYVDDFKMAGPLGNLDQGWALIRKSGIELDPPTAYSQYLGCGQQSWDVPQSVFDKRMASIRAMLPEHDKKQYKSATSHQDVFYLKFVPE